MGSFDGGMLDPVIDLLNDQTPLYPPWGRVVVVVALFALAWAIARGSAFVAKRVVAWHDRRHAQSDRDLGGRMAAVKRQETTVGIVRTAIAYVAFALAAVLSLGQVTGGIDRLATIAGGVFAILVAAFVAQRVLVDLIAGFTMFAERWYSVGDTVVLVAAQELQGVVEDVTLRRTKLRAVTGETINIHNSQIIAAKVLPSGVKELALELFVSDRAGGERLVEETALIVPEGPTTFARRPWIERVEEYADSLVRITVRATVTPGREWLAEDFFPDLLHERARDGLIVHGPVTLAVDERATRSFARATAATRWTVRRASSVPAA
jgi:small-conductance mechanosensitive channel